MTRLRRRRKGSRLFALYAVASLVLVTILGAVLVRGAQNVGRSRGLDQGRAQAAIIEQMAIAPALSGADLSAGITSAQRDRLQKATDLAIFSGSVSQLHLLSLNGVVVFSDDGSVLGAVPVADPAFRSAAAGQVDVRIVEIGPQSSVAIRVLEPVIATSIGEVVGVLEVYLPYGAIAEKVQVETSRTITRLALGLVGLYAVLALISWGTTRSLRRFAADHLHQALHDPLTGMPNRELFRQSLDDALGGGRRGERGAVVLIDLDHFKEVNDTLGHHAGDELLRIVGRRLMESLRTDDVVARLGGDEFGLILPRGGSHEETIDLLTRVQHELGQEIMLDHVALSVEASFGVCFYPEGAETVEGLLQHADAAMYRGKHGTSGVVVYDPGTPLNPTHALVMQGELRGALEREEFVLYYQPKIELATGRVSGVEALVRWQHPQRGLLPPSDFLPVAERSELIEPLTEWVLRRALADYRTWTAAGLDWTVAVNISARSLGSLTFADRVHQILQETGVRPSRVHFEVTETALAFDTKLAGDVFGTLAKQGIPMSIDDFGIGYTSLSQLRTLKVSEVKIDQTFIAGLPDNEKDRAIVRSVIDLGHNLGFLVTAEGVEFQDTADWLLDAGCDHAQGYLWLRPLPWTDVARVFGPKAPTTPQFATLTASAEAWAGSEREA